MSIRVQRFVLALVLILAACGGATEPGVLAPTELTVTADLAVVAADGIQKDIELMRDEQRWLAAIAHGLECRLADDGWFHCPVIEAGGLTTARSYALFGVEGIAQVEWNPETTAEVHLRTRAAGSRTREDWSAELIRHRAFIASGLAGLEFSRQWDGTGVDEITRSRHGDGERAREYLITTASRVSAVVIPVPRDRDVWPLSGQVTTRLTATLRGQVLRERICRVIFNGTQFVRLTIDGVPYVLDLATGTATPA